jgi:NIMA (never in mitosis gene a)-related kinase
LIYL